MRKRLFSLVTLVLVLCLAVPVYGASAPLENAKTEVVETAIVAKAPDGAPEENVKISREKAVEIVKSLFEVPEDYQPEIYFNANWYPGNRKVWSINYYRPYYSIYASVDADTGEIIAYNRGEDWGYPYTKRKVFLAKYTRDEARIFAENFIRKAAPDKVSKVKFTEESYYYGPKFGGIFEPASYFFRFTKAEAGIQMVDYYGDEGINVTVNAVNGEIMNYNLNWTEQEPISEKTISQKEAEDIYKKYLGPELVYVRGFDEKNGRPEDSARLVYAPARFGYMGPPLSIRAKDGALINYGGQEIKQIDPLENPDFSGAKTITPILLKTPVSRKEAQKIAENELKKFGLGEMSLQSYNNDPANPEGLYYFNFTGKETKEVNANVTVNAATGRIQGFGFWKNTGVYYPETQVKQDSSATSAISWEDAKNKAMEFVSKFMPDKAGQVKFMGVPQEINVKVPYQNYYFNFTRIVNGIPYMGNSIGINIDSMGEVVGMNYGWDDINFPAPEKNIISREMAAEALFKEIGITLSYVMPKMYGYYGGPEAPQKPDTPEKILVYAVKRANDFAYIDAYSGKPLNYAFKEPGTVNPPFQTVEIKGDTGRREAQLLLEQGLFDPALKSLDLEKVPNLKEAVKFFTLCLGAGPDEPPYKPIIENGKEIKPDPDKKYTDAAVRHKLVTEDELRNLDKPLSRQELAKLTVRFLGYGPLAEKAGIFRLDAADEKDIDEGYEGFVASALALGIMEKSGDKFLPKEKVVFGEMIKALYSAAEILQQE